MTFKAVSWSICAKLLIQSDLFLFERLLAMKAGSRWCVHCAILQGAVFLLASAFEATECKLKIFIIDSLGIKEAQHNE